MRTLFLLLATLPLYSLGQQTDSITVYFDFNRSDLTPRSTATFDRYFQTNRQHFFIQSLSFSGYCDNIGDDNYNDSLSVRRVLSVKDYLIRTWFASATIAPLPPTFPGLPPDLIIELRGYGKRHPSNDNRTEQQRAINRRVVLVLQKIPLTAPAATQPSVAQPATPATTSVSAILKDTATPATTSVSAILKDTATTIGTSIVLKNVNFYGGRHFPLDNSYPALDDLLRAMKENPKLIIRIEGHVCCIPESMDGPDIDTHQPNLSVTRARFVYDYLMEHGIDSARMSYLGLGAANKIYPEERDPFEQALNRRVEVRVMAK